MYEDCAKRLKNMNDLATLGTVNIVPWLSEAYGWQKNKNKEKVRKKQNPSKKLLTI